MLLDASPTGRSLSPMKPLPKILTSLLTNLLFVGLVQAQSEAAHPAPSWMGVDSFAGTAELRAAMPAEADAGRSPFPANVPVSMDAMGSFRMLSLQGAAVLPGDEAGEGVAFEASTSPVPELHTYALILAGLGVVGFMARRRSGQ